MPLTVRIMDNARGSGSGDEVQAQSQSLGLALLLGTRLLAWRVFQGQRLWIPGNHRRGMLNFTSLTGEAGGAAVHHMLLGIIWQKPPKTSHLGPGGAAHYLAGAKHHISAPAGDPMLLAIGTVPSAAL